MDSIKLMQLLASRICHDLISPIGAIGSGLELLESSDSDLDPQIFQLLKESSETAAKRLSYLRAALGYNTARHFSSLEDIHALLSSYAEPHIQVKWAGKRNDDIEDLPRVGRLIANMFLLAVETLPRGGSIEISIHSSKEVLLQATGKCVRVKEDVIKAFAGQLNIDDLTPRTLQPFLLHLLSAARGLSIQLDEKEGGARFLLSQPSANKLPLSVNNG
ncbi:MAG: hypothetical protein GY915_01845 [bacterium]|nr:hypothetical protein [bacterium]